MDHTRLIVTLVEHLGLIVAAAFLLLTMGASGRRLLKGNIWLEKLIFILFFGTLGILGTYGGDAVLDSVANLRAIGIITGGLFGGPLVGLGAGLMAGGHRIIIDYGGFTALPCGLATILEGVSAGLISLWLKPYFLNWRAAVVLGIIGESVHMLLVLALSRPFEDALALVRIIAVPMIVVNSVGAGLFVEIIRAIFRERERKASNQVQQILNIVNLTVSHLRSGLNMESARQTAEIIHNNIDVSAVSITDTAHVLAHIGVGDDHHLPGEELQTESTRRALVEGKRVFHKSSRAIGCRVKGCLFCSAIIVPLKKGDNIVGVLKLYGTRDKPLDLVHFQTVSGLADLFSTQLELEDIQVKSRMLAHAEIRRLQSQINPHFLFNSLNTIASFCRVNSGKARELIYDLASYMRRNLDGSRDFVKLSDEIAQVESYLAIEKARFGNRIRVEMDIDSKCLDWPIPSLIIQPIVENAVKHGLCVSEEGGTVVITISVENNELSVSVTDDGAGMTAEQVESVFRKERLDTFSGGIGIRNSNHRLEQIYGPEYRMRIYSFPGQGTTVIFKVPDKPAFT